MPFGLDLKSLIIGIIIAYFVLPRVLGMLASRKSAPAGAPAAK